MDKTIFIQKTLHYAEQDDAISVEVLRLVVLLAGVDIIDLFDMQSPTNNTPGRAIPFHTKHALIQHIRNVYFQHLTTQTVKQTVKQTTPHTNKKKPKYRKPNPSKTKGGWTDKNQQAWENLTTVFEDLCNTKDAPADVSAKSKSKNTPHIAIKTEPQLPLFVRFQTVLHYLHSVGVLFTLSMLLNVFFVMRSKSKRTPCHTDKIIHFFNDHWAEVSKLEELVQKGNLKETYKKSNVHLQFVDRQIHAVFDKCTKADEVRYRLLRLRKKRSIFAGRTILKEHLLRKDGSVRESCGEMARAIHHYWENRHLIGILYNTIHATVQSNREHYFGRVGR
jgi:hypothetical protein